METSGESSETSGENLGNDREDNGKNIENSENNAETSSNQYNFNPIDLLNLSDNLETIDFMFKQVIFQPHNRQSKQKYRTTMSIDLDKVKNLKSMASLCESSVNINNIKIINIRPDINMTSAFKNSEVNKISLTGIADADNMVQIFEKA